MIVRFYFSFKMQKMPFETVYLESTFSIVPYKENDHAKDNVFFFQLQKISLESTFSFLLHTNQFSELIVIEGFSFLYFFIWSENSAIKKLIIC